MWVLAMGGGRVLCAAGMSAGCWRLLVARGWLLAAGCSLLLLLHHASEHGFDTRAMQQQFTVTAVSLCFYLFVTEFTRK